MLSFSASGTARERACPLRNLPLRNPASWLRGFLLAAALSVSVSAPPAAAGVMRDADGWTAFTPSEDTRTIYVSNSRGDDGNSGLSPDSPVRSLDRGKSLLRDEHPDWMMLRRGDVWTNESLGDWRKRGRSAQEPMRIGAYGTGDRPLLKTGTDNGITAWQNRVDHYSHIAITDLHFKAHTYTGDERPTGIRWSRPGENLLIENVRIEGYKDNIVIRPNEGSFQNVRVRRSLILDSFAKHTDLPGGSHSQGVYMGGNTDGILLEGNIFDHNGWNPGVDGAEPTVFNHNIYLYGSVGPDVTVRNNIIARASAHGLQARSGGVVEGNVFVDNALAFDFGGDGGGIAADNLVLHASKRTHRDGLYRARGIDMKDVEGAKLLRNIVAQTPGYGRRPIIGLDGVIAEANIIFNWGSNDDLGPFLDPERTLGTYDEMIGGEGSIESFLAAARRLSRLDWREEYTAAAVRGYFPYTVKGFGITNVPEPSGLAMMGLAGLALLRRRPRRRQPLAGMIHETTDQHG